MKKTIDFEELVKQIEKLLIILIEFKYPRADHDKTSRWITIKMDNLRNMEQMEEKFFDEFFDELFDILGAIECG